MTCKHNAQVVVRDDEGHKKHRVCCHCDKVLESWPKPDDYAKRFKLDEMEPVDLPKMKTVKTPPADPDTPKITFTHKDDYSKEGLEEACRKCDEARKRKPDDWTPAGRCGACGGSGFRDEAGTICPTCDGTGLMYLPRGE